jgi:hypothetical protein
MHLLLCRQDDKTKTFAEIETFWKAYVEGICCEGIIARSTVYGIPMKVKPKKDVDAVIIGINKKSSSGEETCSASTK